MTTQATAAAAAEIADYRDSYSDVYKDAYGFRPRHDTEDWTLEQWKQVFHTLGLAIAESIAEEEEAHSRAVVEVERTIARLIGLGAADREAAIRWLHDAENTGGDPEYLCYCLGLPYGYFK